MLQNVYVVMPCNESANEIFRALKLAINHQQPERKSNDYNKLFMTYAAAHIPVPSFMKVRSKYYP